MKISVIMGVYNPVEQKQLQAAVRSMIRRTMTDWELILCDDGSHITYQPLIDKAIRKWMNGSSGSGIRRNKGLGYSLNQCLTGIAKEGNILPGWTGMSISERNGFGSSMIFGTASGVSMEWDQIPDCLMNMVCGGADCYCRKSDLEASDFLSYSRISIRR